MTCAELHEAMKKIFGPPGYTYMREVRNATGFDSTRSADAMALGMYQSRGRELWGFEMKVSRSDWVKELEQADKAESWMRYCDRWALVAGDASIVHPGELPSTWGLYAPVKGKLKCITPCPLLHPAPLTRIALTALMYASQKVDGEIVGKQIEQAVAEAKKHFYDQNERDAEAYRELSKRVEGFEKHTGLRIQYANDDRIAKMGEVVNLVLHGSREVEDQMRHVKYAISSVRDMLPALEKQLELLGSASSMVGATDNEY